VKRRIKTIPHCQKSPKITWWNGKQKQYLTVRKVQKSLGEPENKNNTLLSEKSQNHLVKQRTKTIPYYQKSPKITWWNGEQKQYLTVRKVPKSFSETKSKNNTILSEKSKNNLVKRRTKKYRTVRKVLKLLSQAKSKNTVLSEQF
jgi:hypothetical protein